MKIHNRDLKIEKQGLIFKSMVKLPHDENELMLYQIINTNSSKSLKSGM